MSSPAPGWYPDPSNAAVLRYWDGTQWTNDTRPAQQAAQPGQPAGAWAGPAGTGASDLADPAKRIIGYIIDSLITGVGIGILVVALTRDDFTGGGGFQVQFRFGAVLLSTILSAAYFILLIGLRGQTVGMMAMGTKAVLVDTRQIPGYGPASVRWAITGIPGLIPVLGALWNLVVVILSLVWLFQDPLRQTVWDKVARTIVVNANA